MTVLTTLACTITNAGINKPPYTDVFETLQARFKSIYGNDAYIDPDSQDGQLLAVLAKAVDDCNAMAVAAYNAYSPATSLGTALGNNVRLNGIARAIATNSTVSLTLGGTAGTFIARGVAADNTGTNWVLPRDITIPIAGVITVLATSENLGTFNAPAGSVTKIMTPTLGWQTVTNPVDSVPGAPVETDAALRRRQTQSVALPSQTVLAGILGAILGLPGVIHAMIYENDSDVVDGNGQPAHSIAVVVQGGDPAAIAQAIVNKKTPGAYTFGTTVMPVTDPNGIVYNIRFFIPTVTPLSMTITIKALARYSVTIGDQIKQALADYVNGLAIGQRVDIGKLYLPAQFYGGIGSETFEVNEIRLGIIPAVEIPSDVNIGFNQVAGLNIANINLVVTTF